MYIELCVCVFWARIKKRKNILHSDRYQILNPRGIKDLDDPKKASKVLIESTELSDDLYRLGHTKAWISSIWVLNKLNQAYQLQNLYTYRVDGSTLYTFV